jgi:hypothetical protein
MKRKIQIVGLALAALIGAGLASAQFAPAGTGIRQVVDNLYEFSGIQKFRSDVAVGGNLAVTGNETITGNSTVTGSATVTGTLSAAGVTDTTADFATTIRRVQVVVTAAQLKALSGTPITVLADAAGYLVVPVMCQFDKAAGTAYTLNSVAELAVDWNGSTTVACFTYTANTLDQAGAKTGIHTLGPTSILGDPYTFDGGDLASPFGGAGLVLKRVGGTDMSVGTGSLTVTVWYRKVPYPAT